MLVSQLDVPHHPNCSNVIAHQLHWSAGLCRIVRFILHAAFLVNGAEA